MQCYERELLRSTYPVPAAIGLAASTLRSLLLVFFFFFVFASQRGLSFQTVTYLTPPLAPCHQPSHAPAGLVAVAPMMTAAALGATLTLAAFWANPLAHAPCTDGDVTGASSPISPRTRVWMSRVQRRSGGDPAVLRGDQQ